MLLISQFKGIHRRDVSASSTGTLWPAAAVNSSFFFSSVPSADYTNVQTGLLVERFKNGCLPFFFFLKEGGSILYKPSTRFLPGIWVVGGAAVKMKSNAKINLQASRI